MNYNDELMHYGVPGMKWGVRKSNYAARTARGHAGMGKYATRKRQLAGDKRDLQRLNKGQHLSVGLTKKRQAAFDARDKRNLESRIAKNEKIQQKQQRDPQVVAQRKATAKKVAKGAAVVAGTALTAYAVSKLIKKGSNQVQIKRGEEAGNRALKQLEAIDASSITFTNGRKETVIRTVNSTTKYKDIGLDEAIKTHNRAAEKVAVDMARETAAKNWDLNTRQSAANIARYGVEQVKRRRYK